MSWFIIVSFLTIFLCAYICIFFLLVMLIRMHIWILFLLLWVLATCSSLNRIPMPLRLYLMLILNPALKVYYLYIFFTFKYFFAILKWYAGNETEMIVTEMCFRRQVLCEWQYFCSAVWGFCEQRNTLKNSCCRHYFSSTNYVGQCIVKIWKSLFFFFFLYLFPSCTFIFNWKWWPLMQ